MSRRQGELAYRRMRAPTVDGEAFIDPAWDDLPALTPLAAETDFPILDSSRIELAEQARRELLKAANDSSPESRATSPLILSGHQPELFHAGVWFKNFALHALARAHHATPINVIIDNDLCRSAAIRCPRRDADGGFVVEPVYFDDALDATPYEARRIADPNRFAKFGNEISERMRGVVDDPIIETMWPAAIERGQQGGNLGDAISAGRIAVEKSAGVNNLEAKLSHVCETDSFRRFCLQLAANAESFRELHNETLALYRRVNRVRSQAHPAPELAQQGQWIETPFWVWTDSKPERAAAFIRPESGGDFTWGAPNSIELRIPNPHQHSNDAVNAFREASERGVRIRSRALTTTMYSRLFLADLFIHGIGGAKYDQLTDELIRRFWNVPAPPFVTVTATMRLPLPLYGVGPNDLRATAARLRSLRFHPERHLDSTDGEAAELVAEKRTLIAEQPERGKGKPRRERLEVINRELQGWLIEQRDRALQQRVDDTARYRSDRLLGSREFSFCLHSKATLPARLLDLCAKHS